MESAKRQLETYAEFAKKIHGPDNDLVKYFLHSKIIDKILEEKGGQIDSGSNPPNKVISAINSLLLDFDQLAVN